MDNLNLKSDEAVIQKTQTIIIDGVRYEAVLTGRRLILVESETGRIHEDIPLADISGATSGVNKLREPVITICFNAPDGGKRTLELIFIRLVEGQNIKEVERCLVIIRQHNIPVEGKTLLAEEVRLDRGAKSDTDELMVGEKVSRPAVPEWSFTSTLSKVKKLPMRMPQNARP